MALIQRLIETTFTLANGTFKESGKSSVTLSGYRTSVRCTKAGTPTGGTADMSIFGVSLSIMNQLATLGMVYQEIPRNTVQVRAGDTVNGMSIVFEGTVLQAYGDFTGAPQVALKIEAQTLASEAVIQNGTTSTEGATNAAEFMKSLASKMNLRFENNGVDKVIPASYFYGPLVTQAQDCADAGNFLWTVDNGILAIWPKGKAREGSAPTISSETGMVGYPSFTAYGLLVTTIYNPGLRFGGKMTIKSTLTPANKTWQIIKIDHQLDSLVPNGKWFSTIEGYSLDYPTPVVK